MRKLSPYLGYAPEDFLLNLCKLSVYITRLTLNNVRRSQHRYISLNFNTFIQICLKIVVLTTVNCWLVEYEENMHLGAEKAPYKPHIIAQAEEYIRKLMDLYKIAIAVYTIVLLEKLISLKI